MLLLSVTMGIPFHEIREWSSAEVMLYQCYYRISPWGPERTDINSAMQLSQTANMHRDVQRKPEPYELTDFMPFSEQPEKEDEEVGVPKGLREAFTAMSRKGR